MSISKIVLTGGPCAGKTTALSMLEQKLTEKGYKVIIVSESATEMMLSGFLPSELGETEFENYLIDWQIAKEKIAFEATKHFPKAILLLDRGIPDCIAYMDQKDYVNALKCRGLSVEQALNRYDAVFHLVTAAKGAEKFYTCANNAARKEKDLVSAREADEKTQKAYIGHPHLRIIDNETDFSGKIAKLCSEVFSVLGEPVPLEIERKFLIEKPTEESLKKLGAVKQKITQAYLTPKENIERRIRQRGNDSDFTYYYTEKITLTPIKRIERECKITEKEYLNLLTDAQSILHKNRWCFLEQGLYFELDTFNGVQDKALLEIELNRENQVVKLPSWCKIIEEVTNNPDYRNIAIAEKGFPL